MKIEHARICVISLCMLVSMPALAAEIITQEDISQEVIRLEQLIRLADSALFMLDTSSSMNDEYNDTGKSRLKVVVDEIKRRNAYVPDLGYNFGIYSYTPWTEFYSLKPYDREGVAAALDALPAEGSGPTRLARGLDKIEPILQGLSGRTVVFLFTDGQYTGKRRPSGIARRLAQEHGVCFYVISSAGETPSRLVVEQVAGINECSRVIPFEYFIERPEYTTGALFEVKATEMVLTRTESRIVGLEVDPLRFGFDSTELDATAKAELDEIADFLDKNPGSYVVINGYTDNSGPEEYNLRLSHQRTESAAAYLTDSRGIERNRIVLYWYGPQNPAASNDTREGREKNRRLEMAVGGL